MSEFTYYGFQKVGRPLSQEAIKEVGALSSRSLVTPFSARFLYNYGSFKHDPEKVLLDYFDVFLFVSNYGTKRISFKVPSYLIDQSGISFYEFSEVIEISHHKEHTVITCVFEDEGEWQEEDEIDGVIAMLASLRQDLLSGDNRVLYLTWIAASDRDKEMPFEEIVVPNNLKTLTPAMNAFCSFFGIQQSSVERHAAKSLANNASNSASSYDIEKLSPEEKDYFLVKFLRDEPDTLAEIKLKLMKNGE
jgi:hypothetical protein